MSDDANAGGRTPLLPGAALGVVGGGQLGRYFVLEARRLGYVTWVLDPDPDAPAMQVAQHPLVGAYDDAAALARLGAACDGVTIEFENVPAASLERLAELTRVAPSASSVSVAQDRAAEKRAALASGLRPVPHAEVRRAEDIAPAIAVTGLPGILKTARLGYDGKGQRTCTDADAVRDAWEAMGRVPCVLERRIELAAEISVVLARGFDGVSTAFPVAANVHEAGVLATSTVPSGAGAEIESGATALALALADGLDHHGVLGVEFFLDADGELWFNEMAPRPHNSGHYTLDATATSQFEQQLRVLCALPAGDTALRTPVAMVNLLGDLWHGGVSPGWAAVMATGGARLHLYGKGSARAGRKMGHVNCAGVDGPSALRTALAVRRSLGRARDEGDAGSV